MAEGTEPCKHLQRSMPRKDVDTTYRALNRDCAPKECLAHAQCNSCLCWMPPISHFSTHSEKSVDLLALVNDGAQLGDKKAAQLNEL